MNPVVGSTVMLMAATVGVAGCQVISNENASDTRPGEWQKGVGARPSSPGPARLQVSAFGAVADGQRVNTREIQQAIDACAAAGGGTVSFGPGDYVMGALFLKSGVSLVIPKGTQLLGAESDDQFPIIHTRAGGIELDWPAALINVRDAARVSITGGGTINARGARWWKKFYDALPEYERKGIRWAVDYDTGRPHLMQIYNSSDVVVEDLLLQESPFWTMDVVYSHHITVQRITVRNNRPGQTPDKGPSTDGINIDSSRFCLVQNCDVDCNDDCFSAKAGMNADGLRVNRPCEYVVFRNNTARLGDGGITIGSDMSGGVRHIEAYGFTCIGTKEGLRMKSARVRGGVVEDIYFHDFVLTSVPRPISFNLDWFPAFSYPVLPTDGTPIKPHWRVMAEHVPEEKAIPTFRDIVLRNIKATGARDAITINGLKEKPIANVLLENIGIAAQHAGGIHFAKDWQLRDVHISAADGSKLDFANSQNIQE